MFKPGDEISGRYRVVRRLGGGGMGDVYLAEDSNLSAEVVLKCPKPHLVEDASIMARFKDEAESMVRLRHPHIVPVLDVGEHEKLPYVAIAFLDGGDLYARTVARSHLPVEARLEDLNTWLPQVARALDFVHAKGFVHRDVKPENVFFDADGNAYLADFGIAKSLKDKARGLTGTGQAIGTVDYMAPEAIKAEEVDGRADQYSLAVTVFEILTGKFPIEGKSGFELTMNIVQQPPARLNSVRADMPPGIDDALAKALAKAPADRFETCEQFATNIINAGRGSWPEQTKRGQFENRDRAIKKQSADDYQNSTAVENAANTANSLCPSCFESFNLHSADRVGPVACPSCGSGFRLSAVRRAVENSRTDSDLHSRLSVGADVPGGAFACFSDHSLATGISFLSANSTLENAGLRLKDINSRIGDGRESTITIGVSPQDDFLSRLTMLRVFQVDTSKGARLVPRPACLALESWYRASGEDYEQAIAYVIEHENMTAEIGVFEVDAKTVETLGYFTFSHFDPTQATTWDRLLESCDRLAGKNLECATLATSKRVHGVAIGELPPFCGRSFQVARNPSERIAIGASIQSGVLNGVIEDCVLLDATANELKLAACDGAIIDLLCSGTTFPTSKYVEVVVTDINSRVATLFIIESARGLEGSPQQTMIGQLDVPFKRGVARAELRVTIGIEASGQPGRVTVASDDIAAVDGKLSYDLGSSSTIPAPTRRKHQARLTVAKVK